MSWLDHSPRQGRRGVHTDLSMDDEYDEAAGSEHAATFLERVTDGFLKWYLTSRGMAVEILLNGEKRQVESGLTLAKLLESLEIRTGSVAVEHNEKVIPRRNLEHFALNSGDKVEIVRFVGGG